MVNNTVLPVGDGATTSGQLHGQPGGNRLGASGCGDEDELIHRLANLQAKASEYFSDTRQAIVLLFRLRIRQRVP